MIAARLAARPAAPAHDDAARPAAARAPCAIQAKLRIGSVDDPLEREADRAADAVIRGEPAHQLGRATAAPQRKCAGCEAEDRDEMPVQRKPASCAGSEGAQASGEAAARAVAGGGAPLSPELRSYFEPRFGLDLADVRVHADARAGRAAEAISARAFTVGDDIGFAAGEFAPQHPEGRRLIAHELAHTVQQAPFVARQEEDPFRPRRFPERGGGGTTDFEETVQIDPTHPGPITGSVTRREIAPASETDPEEEIHSGTVDEISFDPSCVLTIPYRLSFQQAASAGEDFCEIPPPATPVTPLTAAEMTTIGRNYVDDLNAGLNDWYAVSVSGCDDVQPCTDRNIPVRIEVTEDDTSPHRIITVVNRAGRGNAGTICAREYDSGFATHEGGHQVLRLGDEYPELDPDLLQQVPQWGRRERVRTDLTQMGSHSRYGPFAQFHERHFRFAEVFLDAAYHGHGCTVRLVRLRAPPADVRLQFGIGATFAGAEGFLSAAALIGLGIPLEPERRAMLEAGILGQLFVAAGRYRHAYLLGVRLGLEGRTALPEWGFSGTVFGSAGMLHRPEAFGDEGTRLPERTSGYGEAGVGVGFHTPLVDSVNLQIRAEVAGGAEIADDPEAMEWVRTGLTMGASF
jgi:hypothetical protein